MERFPFEAKKQEFYLTVSRLVSYKKIDLIVRAFNQLGYPLVVIGSGPQASRLQALAQSNIKFLGSQPNSVVEEYMSQAKAFVYAACEDFGIAPVEAQACGTPVIAYGAGGALETVRDIRQWGKTGTGVLFKPQTETALMEAVKTFEELRSRFQPEAVRSHSVRFAPTIFEQRYLSYLERCCRDFQRGIPTESQVF